MELSYNGWTASTSAKEFGGLDNRTVGGVKCAPGVRAGDVATVLFYVAEQFAKRVEKLETPGCWGYSYRQNRNANNLSCHASATAIDLNAPRHPNGKRGTFTKPQVAEIRRILAEVGGVVRWGGDFTGTPDEMHFEIVASPATVAMVADRLNRSGAAVSPIKHLPPVPTIPEDDMAAVPQSEWDEAIRLLRRMPIDVWSDQNGQPAVVQATGAPQSARAVVADTFANARAAATLAAVIASRDDVDEEALGRSIAGALLPDVLRALADSHPDITVADVEAALRRIFASVPL